MMTLTPDKLNTWSEVEKEQYAQILNNIIIKCWEDNSFQESLTSDPVSVCKENGLIIEGFNKVVVSDREGVEGELTLRIPPKPSTAELEAIELSEEELEKQAGGLTPTPTIKLTLDITLTVVTIVHSIITIINDGKEEADDWRGGKKKGG